MDFPNVDAELHNVSLFILLIFGLLVISKDISFGRNPKVNNKILADYFVTVIS